MSAFFLNRRFSDQRFLQAFSRGLLGGGLFLLVLSVFFLGLGRGTSAFAQAEQAEQTEQAKQAEQVKKHYLGGGLAFLSLSGEETYDIEGDAGTFRGLPVSVDHTVSNSFEGGGLGVHVSYIHLASPSFWLAPTYTLAVWEDQNEDESEVISYSYASLDLHVLYKTPVPLFIGGGMSSISYEEHLDPDEFEGGGLFKIDDFAPSFRMGALFAGVFAGTFGPGSLMLDAVWRAEVRSDFMRAALVNDTALPVEGETSIVSFQLSASYLFNF